MKQLVMVLIGALLVPIASAQDVGAGAPMCPGALESSVVMAATGQSFAVRTEGVPTRYNVFPTYRQTIVSSEGAELLNMEVTKLNDDRDVDCRTEMTEQHEHILDEITSAAPAGSFAERRSGPLLEDVVACLKSDRRSCESQNSHQLEIAYGVTDEDAEELLLAIEAGAYEFTLYEGGTVYRTYYFVPSTGKLLPVLDGGC
ncbi:MAG: hypothetical protein ABJG15_14820 [Hyphomonadaceae bacterium]